jgi:hypothetical protein
MTSVSNDLTELIESAIQLDAMMTRGHVRLHAIGRFHNAVSRLVSDDAELGVSTVPFNQEQGEPNDA